jgi:hypothetical protein
MRMLIAGDMSNQIRKSRSITQFAKKHQAPKGRVTYERLTAMLVERGQSEALGYFREGGGEYYTYLWYGGPKGFFQRLNFKLSQATLDEWSDIFDSLLKMAKHPSHESLALAQTLSQR